MELTRQPFSSTQKRRFFLVASTAQASPAGPAPTMIRSSSSFIAHPFEAFARNRAPGEIGQPLRTSASTYRPDYLIKSCQVTKNTLFWLARRQNRLNSAAPGPWPGPLTTATDHCHCSSAGQFESLLIDFQSSKTLRLALKPLLFFLLAFSSPAEPLSGEAQFLRRGDLPHDFDFPLLELDFAVLRLRLENGSQEAWTLQPDQLQVLTPKGKPMRRVTPFDITPKIMGSKEFKRSRSRVHAQASSVSRYPSAYPGPGGIQTVDLSGGGGGGGVGIVSADTAGKIRAVLEQHEAKETTLAPGKTLEALLYFKSKKPPSKLSGSTLLIGKKLKVKIP